MSIIWSFPQIPQNNVVENAVDKAFPVDNVDKKYVFQQPKKFINS